jgi:hypothetical protein
VGVDAASQATLLLRRRKAVSDAEAELSARKAATRARMAELAERAARLAAKRGALEATAQRFALKSRRVANAWLRFFCMTAPRAASDGLNRSIPSM